MQRDFKCSRSRMNICPCDDSGEEVYYDEWEDVDDPVDDDADNGPRESEIDVVPL